MDLQDTLIFSFSRLSENMSDQALIQIDLLEELSSFAKTLVFNVSWKRNVKNPLITSIDSKTVN